MSEQNIPIDAVILWVDGNDPEWQLQKDYYLSLEQEEPENIAAGTSRYRDWGLLKYIFRGIEKYAPWINKVFLVTNGQKPEWLSTDAKRFRLITHEEFIPHDCLPTFSSQAIDLNLWRIEELSEHFIYLNDDTFLTRIVTPEDFFHQGLPRDIFSERPVFTGETVMQCNLLNNICAVSRHYSRREVLRKNRGKILNVKYGLVFFYNLIWYMLPFKKFCGLYMHHLPTGYRKSQMKRAWEQNADVCERTIHHRFRRINDVNQYIFNEEQLLSGEFWPSAMQRQGVSLSITGDNTEELCKLIEGQKWKRLCLNDFCPEDRAEETKQKLIEAFEKILPEKSWVEK